MCTKRNRCDGPRVCSREYRALPSESVRVVHRHLLTDIYNHILRYDNNNNNNRPVVRVFRSVFNIVNESTTEWKIIIKASLRRANIWFTRFSSGLFNTSSVLFVRPGFVYFYAIHTLAVIISKILIITLAL